MEMTGALLALPGWELTTLMPGIRFDDQYPMLRKVAGMSDAAFRLHTAAIFWCAWNDTGGFVPEEDLDLVCAQVRDPARFAAECVRRGAWHMADQACGSDDCPEPRDEDGWVIHDYLIYPAGDEMEVTEKKSSGGKWGNHKRWHEQRGITDPECQWCTPSVSESDSDRIPMSESDRSANPSRSKSKSDLSLVDVGNQSSVRNARGSWIESPLAAEVARVADSFAQDPDDDDLLKVVIDSIHHKTRQVITAVRARSIAAEIFGSAKGRVGNRVRYAQKAIQAEQDPVGRWITAEPAPEPEPAPPCGKCNPSRHLEDPVTGADLGRCPDCHPSITRSEAS